MYLQLIQVAAADLELVTENDVALPEALQGRVKIHAQASVAGRHAKQRQAQVFCRNQKQHMTHTQSSQRAENNKGVASPE